MSEDTTGAIAVVGIGCRYPDASSQVELWESVLAGRRAFRPLPRERLSRDDYFAEAGGDADTTYLRYAAVLDGWSFERARFRVPGAVFRVTDLTHWLALDVAADTLSAAGFAEGRGLPAERSGVVLGNTLTGEFTRAGLLRLRWPYVRRVLQETLATLDLDESVLAGLLATAEQRYKEPFPAPTEESLVGGLANAIAGRVCNQFDLNGGGYTVDGACASSLLAVVTACAALRDGDLDFALAGGVDLSLDPFELVGFARVGALATSAMRIYDARPTGFLPGEGCGMVALMRADDAIAEGRTPLALIKGWGVSSDGRGGLTRPEAAGQLLALRRAYARAGFGPETVALFEGHGTGTAVGDQAELRALRDLLADRRPPAAAALGSIKANIGHTKAAAGIAGLIKATLAVQRQVIPPTTGCAEPHELLRDPGTPLRAVREAEPWPDWAEPRRAAVSAMGFGGINTHVVLEGNGPSRTRRLSVHERRTARGALAFECETFFFSAATTAELAGLLDRVAVRAERMSLAEHVDLAASMAAACDPTAPLRAAVVAADPAQLFRRARRARQLLVAAPARGYQRAGGVHLGQGPAGRIGLLFPGQGAPLRPGPGALGAVLPSAKGLFGAAPSVDTAIAQPAIFRASLAGLQLLDRLGVAAGAAAGHSLGEITALCWAGALRPADAERLVTARGRVMADTGAPGTGMASIAAPKDKVTELIAGIGLVIAADNGPSQVVAGPLAGIAEVLARAHAAGLGAARLRVSHAFHSAAVAAAEPLLAEVLATVPVAPLARRLHSTITGRELPPTADVRLLLARQVTGAVRFREAVESLAAECDLLVETGPGHALTALATDVTTVPVVALDAGEESARPLCETAGALFAVGAVTDPGALFAERFHRPFDLWRDPDVLASPCESAPDLAAPRSPALPAAEPEESAGPPPGDVGTAVRMLVAQALELDPEAIDDGERLLGDLHLSSLRVVQLAAEAARACGRAVPAVPPSVTETTVGGLIGVIEALPVAAPGGGEGGAPAGVHDWYRVLVADLRPVELTGAAERSWRCYGDVPLRAAGEARLGSARGAPPAIAVFLPEDPDDQAVDVLVAAATEAVRTATPLTIVDLGDTASGFAGTLAQEHPRLPVRWIRVSRPDALAAVLPTTWTGYQALVLDESGRVHALSHRPAALGEVERTPRLGPGDVLMVTGGGRGIGFECAAFLARRWGVALALVGRADPDGDAELRANLGTLRAAGVPFRYVMADVTDADAMRRAVAQSTGELGPIAGVLHCSGVNRPRRFADLDAAAYAEHAAPKRNGLRTLIGALDPGSLRLILTFGSVIGRFGLAGEAHYALANGRLRELARVLARDLPGCLVRNIDWSVWSGTGMGERLDTLGTLAGAGVVPVPIEHGVRLLATVAEAGQGPYSVLATGRLPQLGDGGPPPHGGRFLQRILTHTRGVELIAEAELTVHDDPYLTDHRIDGLLVVPAVAVLEAMTQAASALTGARPCGVLAAEFERPVIVPADGGRVVRICALVRPDGDVDVVVRSAETGFEIDHFSGTVTFADVAAPEVAPPSVPVPEHTGRSLYGPLFFHGPWFQRLVRYTALGARECTAVLSGSGSPLTRNDASIHVLQACVPHRRLLPVGCQRFAVHRDVPADGELTLRAVERAHTGLDYVYDVVLADSSGKPVVSWTGLRLRDVGALPVDRWPRVLVGPYVERSLGTMLPGADVHVRVTADGLRLDFGAGVSGLSTGGPGDIPAAWSPLAAELSRLTGESAERVRARLHAVRDCLHQPGRPGLPAALTVRAVYEDGWIVLADGADQIVSAVLAIEGEPGPMALAVHAKGGG